MPDYKEMYIKLFRAQIKAIMLLEQAHRKTEEMYLSDGEDESLPPKVDGGSGNTGENKD